jgi:cellulose synthase/poly-beta-1,6-N-acetylglucosamine synthase-like glycosyltransferase
MKRYRIKNSQLIQSILCVILTMFLTILAFAQLDTDFDFNKTEKFYELKGRGISYAAYGNKITSDNIFHPQSVISIINLPRQAKIIKSYLYWTGKILPVSSADTDVTLIMPDERIERINADEVWSTIDGGLIYLCRADVTDYIKRNGAYLLKDIALDPIRTKNGNVSKIYGRCSLIIVYKIPGISSPAKISIYNGLNTKDSQVPLVIEQRPKDAIFYLKKANYFRAFKESPHFVVSYFWQIANYFIIAFAQKSTMFFKPILAKIVTDLSIFFIIYAVLINTIYLLLTVIAAYIAKKYLAENKKINYEKYIKRNTLLPISILISAYNEEVSIARTVTALLRLKYPKYETIVINDGSKDMTLDILKREFSLNEIYRPPNAFIPSKRVNKIFGSDKFKNLYVIDKENSGKADSLNAGINLSNAPLFCTIDADTILEEDALFQLALPIHKNPDEVVVTTGMVRLHNGCTIENGIVTKHGIPRAFLNLIQVVEYIRAYSIGRIGWNIFNAQIIVSGAFALYKKEVVIKLGGYHRYAIGEDVELNMRIHRLLINEKQRYKIMYVPFAQCLTQAPTNIKSLARQRNRWHQGLLTSLKLNMSMLFNPRYGYLGMFAVPFYALFELSAPVLELFGYIIIPVLALFNMVSVKYTLLLLGAVIVYSIMLSSAAIFLDRIYFKFYNTKSYLRLIFCSLFESFGFHQLSVFWRLGGILDYLKQVHTGRIGWRSPDRIIT